MRDRATSEYRENVSLNCSGTNRRIETRGYKLLQDACIPTVDKCPGITCIIRGSRTEVDIDYEIEGYWYCKGVFEKDDTCVISSFDLWTIDFYFILRIV